MNVLDDEEALARVAESAMVKARSWGSAENAEALLNIVAPLAIE